MSEEEQVQTPVENQEESAPAPEPEPEKKEEESARAAPAAACSGECPCEMICKPFQESEFFAQAKEIFMWEPKVMKSLLAFCVINVFFILLLCYDFTVLGLICWICFFALLAALVFNIKWVIHYFKADFEGSDLLADKDIPYRAELMKGIDGFFGLISAIVQAILGVFFNAVLVRSVPFSLGMIFGFLFLIYLAGHMGICAMSYVAILFCFIWFRLYKECKGPIDDLFAKAKKFLEEQMEKLKGMLNKPKTA